MAAHDLTLTSGDPSTLRRLNLQAVLRVLHAGGIHTISELARAAQLSRPTTRQAVEDLLAAGWISASEPVELSGPIMGRPAQKFEFRPEAGHALGADVGAHKILVLIGDLAGREVARARRDVDPEWPAARRLEALGEVIEEALKRFPPGRSAISDAVIGTVGSVDRSGKVIYCKAVPEWEGQNPGSWVSQRFGFRTSGAQDISMSALAEHWRGAAQHARDIVYLHAGRRLGAALLIGGRPHIGHHSAASEIGMWRALSWKPSYDEFMHLSDEGAEDPGGRARKVFETAARGDEAAKARIEDFAADMCQGIAPVIIAVDPELLVIGGGISAAGEAIAEPLRRRINLETDFPPEIVCSTLGDESVALGALRLALDRAEERLFAELAPPL